jgi:ubiquinone/menaquinone biosynthesis C-methylase UbiE
VDARPAGGNPSRKELAMKMRRFEKRFVNSRRHSDRVARRAEARVGTLGPGAGWRLLDVGCGNGAAAIHLAKAFGLDVVGVDVDPDQIAAARAAAAGLGRARFLAASAERLPFADGEFDLVYTSKTTHHIPGWPRALAQMARVLKPGGRLVYSDIVAPAGRRLPTRHGVNSAAAAHGLARERHGGSPFHYIAVFRVPDPSPPLPYRGR